MKKFEEYFICQGKSHFELIVNIREWMSNRDGWELQGGVCFADGMFYQAVVKYQN